MKLLIILFVDLTCPFNRRFLKNKLASFQYYCVGNTMLNWYDIIKKCLIRYRIVSSLMKCAPWLVTIVKMVVKVNEMNSFGDYFVVIAILMFVLYVIVSTHLLAWLVTTKMYQLLGKPILGCTTKKVTPWLFRTHWTLKIYRKHLNKYFHVFFKSSFIRSHRFLKIK
jgi:hypothetical protein